MKLLDNEGNLDTKAITFKNIDKFLYFKTVLNTKNDCSGKRELRTAKLSQQNSKLNGKKTKFENKI